jgi:hypothetical protein
MSPHEDQIRQEIVCTDNIDNAAEYHPRGHGRRVLSYREGILSWILEGHAAAEERSRRGPAAQAGFNLSFKATAVTLVA